MIGYTVKEKTVEYVAIFAVLLFLSMQIAGMSLEANIAKGYTDFYGYLAFQGMVVVVVMGAFSLWYLSHDFIPLRYRLGITAGWLVFMLVISIAGNQMVPIPKASIETLQLTKQTELWTSSVIPGVLEDWNYLVGFPMIISLAYFIGRKRLFGSDVGFGEFVATGIVACLIASTGYNIWVIPGFTSAHVPAYGGADLAYGGAFVFSFGQSLTYFLTGIFLPLPHILHNFIIVYGQIYSIAGGLA